MYLRFVTHRMDERTNQKEGLFTRAYEFFWDIEEGKSELEEWEQTYLIGLISWFRNNMPIPKKFSRRYVPEHKEAQGLSWFKDIGDREIEAKLWELKSFLEIKGESVDILKTKNPGYVVYQDDCQVVAEPMADTFNLKS